MDILSELAVIASLILVNAFLSMSEMAVVSSRKARLKKMADDGHFAYKVALSTAESPRRFLSTIQIGITLIGISNGFIGGAAVAGALEGFFSGIPSVAPWATPIAFAIVVAATTLVSVIFGELIPKSIALANPERFAAFSAIPMRVIGIVFKPVVWFLTFSTELFLKAFRLGKTDEPPVTEEEVKALLEQGAEIGVIEKAEHDMVENIMYMGDKRASAFMTHRMDIAWLAYDAGKDETLATIVENPGVEVFPVCRNGLDDVAGLVYARVALAQIATGAFVSLESIMEAPLLLPESFNAIKTLAAMRSKDARAALIVDEYGGVEGLVTIRDLSYEIVGEAEQHALPQEPSVAKRNDGSYFIDGMLAIDEFYDLFQLKSDEDMEKHNTVAGLVLDLMGRIPLKGDYIEWRGLKIEVADMDGHRIDELLIRKKSV